MNVALTRKADAHLRGRALRRSFQLGPRKIEVLRGIDVDIARGETISDSDLTYSQVAGNALASDTVTSFDALKGMEARRVLRAGSSLRADDVRHPVVVLKGQSITMTFDAPGVLSPKALAASAKSSGSKV